MIFCLLSFVDVGKALGGESGEDDVDKVDIDEGVDDLRRGTGPSLLLLCILP